jgi:metallophosphoesterase (TIGR00282 family)
MDLRILFFGDVVGRPGREALAMAVPELREEFQPDVLLANVENATHGRGVNPGHVAFFQELGFDGLTSGDHVWQYREVFPVMEQADSPLIRPANFPQAPGKGWADLTVKGKRLRLINLQGRVFMNESVDSPFTTFDRLVAQPPLPDVVVVDFHAEATSEKRAFAEYADGRAQLVVGTHTHVPTADAQILAGGTAFITDIGMVGPKDSSLGAEKAEVIQHFLTGLPWRYMVGTGQCELGAVFCHINLEKRHAIHVEHIRRFYTSPDA